MMFELMCSHVVCQLLKALSSTCVMKMKTETVRHVFITAQAVLRRSYIGIQSLRQDQT